MNLDRLELVYNSVTRAENRLALLDGRIRRVEILLSAIAVIVLGKDVISWLL
jgi:hypothetical protein